MSKRLAFGLACPVLLALACLGGDALLRGGTLGYSAPPSPMVARVAGRPVTAAELAGFWFERYPENYARSLDALIDARLARGAGQRLGVGVPQAALDAAVAQETEARRKQLADIYGEGVPLATEVQRAYGVDVAAWQQEILRPRIYDQLLMARVVRLDTRRRPRIEVLVLVREDEASARRLRSQLDGGADFRNLAQRMSTDPTARGGGVLPAIARGDLAFPKVEERLFAARAGDLVGPLPVDVEGRAQWHIYRVTRRLPAWQVGSAELSERLEGDLRERPLARAEYERWRARLARERKVERFRPDGRPWSGGVVRDGPAPR